MTSRSEESHRVTLTGEGRVSLPQRVRESAGFEKGGQLLLTVTDTGGVLLETPTQKLRRVQATFRENLHGAPDLVGELIAERRAEAARDAADEDAEGAA